MKKVCILDYGSGNVKSVYNLVRFLGFDVIISNKKNDIEDSTHIILPGVGSFGGSIKKIKSKIPIKCLEKEILENKKPFLGICVGMQVIFEFGYEYGRHEGLNWIKGNVKKLIVEDLPLPHMGWNNIEIKKEDKIFFGLDEINDFYFIHSYAVDTNQNYILSETEYGSRFCSAIKKDNIYGVQFHPEKSQKTGQKLLKNFLNI